MTKEERLAALKNLESGLQTEIIRATASPDQGFYCVKLDKNADLDLVEEFRIYADLKWEVSYFFTLPSMDHYIGLNYVSQEAATNLRTGFLEWVQAEITKIEQPAPAKPASALPYKVLLNSMESKMGYDSDLRLEYLLISTDENDSKMLRQDISGELVASTDAHLAMIDESLYMYFKTGDHDVAKEMKAKVVEWLKKRIAEIEQPPFDPKEVIEAAAADQEGMDAAESDAGREEIRARLRQCVWRHVFHSEYPAQKAMDNLFMAIEAICTKDKEIAAHRDEIRALNGVIKLMEKDFSKMEASRDEYKKLYQEALAAAEAQRTAKDGEIAALKKKVEGLELESTVLKGRVQWLNTEIQACRSAAEPKDVQPAPVRLPVAGDTIEARFSPDHEWEKVEVYNSERGTPRFIIGKLTVKACQETYNKGNWRWPEPRTRTAADAKVGDEIVFRFNKTVLLGLVTGVDNSSVFVEASDGHVHQLPHHEFGPTGWRFEKEETK